jgi:lysophospholipase L1-like esterase
VLFFEVFYQNIRHKRKMNMANQHSRGNKQNRRDFLRTAAAAAGGLAASSILTSSGCSEIMKNKQGGKSARLTESNNIILFQGDSITDMGRDRRRQDITNDARALGNGYAFLAASEILAEYPGAKPQIYNRGISGNKVFQLAERWDADCLELKPDIVSILIGVNDYWHTFKHGYEGTVETYENDLGALLERTQNNLPGVTLVICEPFVLRCGEVDEKWFPAFDAYRTAAKRTAARFDTIFVPFQSMFDDAIKNAPPEYWSADGVHPTIAGAYLMAQAWLKCTLT